jgi:hypothetical protein
MLVFAGLVKEEGAGNDYPRLSPLRGDPEGNTYNFATGIWSNAQGEKFKDGNHVE